MRTLGEILQPELQCKITLFAWNGKFLVRFEQGPCELTYKFDQFEIENEAELRAKLTPELIRQVAARFASMHEDRRRLIEG